MLNINLHQSIQDSPLLMILELYELCMDYRNYSEAQSRLLAFQASISRVSRPFPLLAEAFEPTL